VKAVTFVLPLFALFDRDATTFRQPSDDYKGYKLKSCPPFVARADHAGAILLSLRTVNQALRQSALTPAVRGH
jgi:hypothetical protein